MRRDYHREKAHGIPRPGSLAALLQAAICIIPLMIYGCGSCLYLVVAAITSTNQARCKSTSRSQSTSSNIYHNQHHHNRPRPHYRPTYTISYQSQRQWSQRQWKTSNLPKMIIFHPDIIQFRYRKYKGSIMVRWMGWNAGKLSGWDGDLGVN